MRIRHIEIFHAVYEHKTISEAARQLNVSQPAVSKALRHAEDQLGFALFTRMGRGLVPTHQAHILFEEVQKVFFGVERVRNTSKFLKKTLQGQLKISTVTGLSYEVLPRTVARVRAQHPQATFELQTLHYSDLITSLREFDTHIGLVFDAPDHAGLIKENLGEAEFSCVYPLSFMPKQSKRIKLQEVLNHDLIALNPNGPLGGKLRRHIQSESGGQSAVATAESCFVAKSLAACGVGVAVVDEFTASAAGFENLGHTKIDPPIPIQVNALYLEARPLSFIAKIFMSAFAEQLAQWKTEK